MRRRSSASSTRRPSSSPRWRPRSPSCGRSSAAATSSAAAIEHLEELRRRGARYLVFPATGLWWLEHYEDLGRHLDVHYRVALRRDDACLIFDLDSRGTP